MSIGSIGIEQCMITMQKWTHRILAKTDPMVQMVVVDQQQLREVHKSFHKEEMESCRLHIPVSLVPNSRYHSKNHVSFHRFFLAVKNRKNCFGSSELVRFRLFHTKLEDTFASWKSCSHRHVVACANKCISLSRGARNNGTYTKVRYFYFTPMIYQYIWWFQISVYNALLVMQVYQSF